MPALSTGVGELEVMLELLSTTTWSTSIVWVWHSATKQ